MSIPLFWLPFLAAHTAPISPAPLHIDAAPRFAHAFTELADAGYQLRDLHTHMSAKGGEVELVLASDHDAQALSLRFDEGAKTFSEFAQVRTTLPTEARIYQHQAELFDELRLSAPQALGFDCADVYLDFGSRSVSLAEGAFEVQVRSTRKRPGSALSSWLGELLEEGELVEVRDDRYDDGAQVSAEVAFVFDGAEGVQELRVAVDEDGHPTELRLVHSPGTEVFKRYHDSAGLRAGIARPIESLSFVFPEEGAPDQFDAAALELRFAKRGSATRARSMRVDMKAFEALAIDECGC